MLKLFLFNGLIGNADGHAKNISLIHDLKGTRLAPFYDLLSTYIYHDFGKRMPGKKRNFLHLKQEHFKAFAHESGFKPDLVIKVAMQMAEKILVASKRPLLNLKVFITPFPS